MLSSREWCPEFLGRCASHPGTWYYNIETLLPNGYIFASFTALGITLQSKRVATCAFKEDSIVFPAAEMSSPESGRALVLQEPLAAMTSK